MTVREQVDDAIGVHCAAREVYKDARYRVALGELWGVFSPDEVNRLESRLGDLYSVLDKASSDLARISAVLEFGEGNVNDV